MEVLIATDAIFYKIDDGTYWCGTIYGYDFWTRYTNVFDSIAVVARVKFVSKQEIKNYRRVDGPNVRIVELPSMRGMKEYLKSYFKFRKASKEAVANANYAIIRLPSVSAFMVLDFYRQKRRPYFVEVVADPSNAYASNQIARIIYTRKLKEAVKNANGVSYVTRNYLQTKYPSYARANGEDSRHFETYYSTIDLRDGYFGDPKKYSSDKKEYIIIHTANSINNYIKGHGTLIKILKKLRDDNCNCSVRFIGDGSKRKHFETYAKKLGVDNYVKFVGLLTSPNDVRNELVKSDLFVLPARSEGLPRSMIEAMAVGLPCLSTPVNGIPELLDTEFMFEPDDVDGFANKIIELIQNPSKLNRMSEINIKKSKEYSWDKLSYRRTNFYEKLIRIN